MENNIVTNPTLSMQDENIRRIDQLITDMDLAFLEVLGGRAEAVKPTINFAHIIFLNIRNPWLKIDEMQCEIVDKLLTTLEEEVRTTRIERIQDQRTFIRMLDELVGLIHLGTDVIGIGFKVKARTK